jgi:hypothetical protein
MSFLNTVAQISILNILVGVIAHMVMKVALSNQRDKLANYFHDNIGGMSREIYDTIVKNVMCLLIYIVGCYIIKVPACFIMSFIGRTPLTFFLPILLCSGFPSW